MSVLDQGNSARGKHVQDTETLHLSQNLHYGNTSNRLTFVLVGNDCGQGLVVSSIAGATASTNIFHEGSPKRCVLYDWFSHSVTISDRQSRESCW